MATFLHNLNSTDAGAAAAGSPLDDPPVRGRILWMMGVALVAAAGMLAGAFGNRFGADITPDSAVSLTAAVRCANGLGISLPGEAGAPRTLGGLGPLYPAGISLLARFHLELFVAIGIVNAIAWSMLILICGLGVWHCTRQCGAMAALGALAALVNGPVAAVYSRIWPETLLLMLTLGGLTCLAGWWRRKVAAWAIGAALFAAAACLTHRDGMSLLIAGAVTMLLTGGIAPLRRIGLALAFAVVGAMPAIAWMWGQGGLAITSQASPGTALARLYEGLQTAATFVLPARAVALLPAGSIVAVAAAALIGALVASIRRRGRGRAAITAWARCVPALVWVCGLFVLIDLTFALTMAILPGAALRLDARRLAVLAVPAILVAAYVLYDAGWRDQRWWRRAAVMIVVMLLLAAQGYATLGTLLADKQPADLRLTAGMGSKTLQAIRMIPKGDLIFCDKPCAVHIFIRRPTEAMPSTPAEIARMRSLLAKRGGWVVFWHRLEEFTETRIAEADVLANLGVVSKQTLADGVVMRVDAGKFSAYLNHIGVP